MRSRRGVPRATTTGGSRSTRRISSRRARCGSRSLGFRDVPLRGDALDRGAPPGPRGPRAGRGRASPPGRSTTPVRGATPRADRAVPASCARPARVYMCEPRSANLERAHGGHGVTEAMEVGAPDGRRALHFAHYRTAAGPRARSTRLMEPIDPARADGAGRHVRHLPLSDRQLDPGELPAGRGAGGRTRRDPRRACAIPASAAGSPTTSTPRGALPLAPRLIVFSYAAADPAPRGHEPRRRGRRERQGDGRGAVRAPARGGAEDRPPRRAAAEPRPLAAGQPGLHDAARATGLHGLQRHDAGRQLPAPALVRRLPALPRPAPPRVRRALARGDGPADDGRARPGGSASPGAVASSAATSRTSSSSTPSASSTPRPTTTRAATRPASRSWWSTASWRSTTSAAPACWPATPCRDHAGGSRKRGFESRWSHHSRPRRPSTSAAHGRVT